MIELAYNLLETAPNLSSYQSLPGRLRRRTGSILLRLLVLTLGAFFGFAFLKLRSTSCRLTSYVSVGDIPQLSHLIHKVIDADVSAGAENANMT